MANVISAQERALADGANAVQAAKGNIDSQIKAVRGEIEEMASYWSGAAASAFTGLLNNWDTQAVKLNNVLITLEDALRTTERDQAASEEAHQQTIAGLGSMMNG